MQHADEILQFLQRDRLRCELGLELVLEFVEARVPVEHLQDGELLLLEAVILQANRLLDDPVRATVVAVTPYFEVRAHPQPERAGRTGNKAVGERNHG